MTEQTEDRNPLKEYDPTLFYAEQVINNACATQAILSVLMNTPEVDIGEELDNLKNFTVGMTPKDIGLTLGNSEKIRQAHNSFARQEPFEIESRKATKDDDVFHFIAYVPHNGKLYELDGLQGGPIELADVDMDAWLPVARDEINKRIEQYASQEVRFNLLAVTGDLLQKYEESINLCKLKISYLSIVLGKEIEDEELEGELTDEQIDSLPTEPEPQEKLLEEIQAELNELEGKKADEVEKRAKWTRENQRRKHNYVPLALEMLKIMAEKKMLSNLYKEAEEVHKKKLEEEEAKKDEGKAN